MTFPELLMDEDKPGMNCLCSRKDLQDYTVCCLQTLYLVQYTLAHIHLYSACLHLSVSAFGILNQ